MKRISRDWRTLSKLIDEGLDPPILDEYIAGVCPIFVYDSLWVTSFILNCTRVLFLMKDEVNSWFGERFPEQLSLAPFSAFMASFFWAEDDKNCTSFSMGPLISVLIVFTDFHHSSILLNNIFLFSKYQLKTSTKWISIIKELPLKKRKCCVWGFSFFET